MEATHSSTPKVAVHPTGNGRWTTFVNGTAVLEITLSRAYYHGGCFKRYDIRRIGKAGVIHTESWFADAHRAAKLLAVGS